MIFIWLQILLPNEKVIYFSCPPHCHNYLKVVWTIAMTSKKLHFFIT